MQPAPASYWIGFHLFVFLLMAAEYAYVGWRRKRDGAYALQSTALTATILWVSAALLFALFILRSIGSVFATEYIAGYAIEQTLSADNLFVFLLLFRVFRIEPANQLRVLFWGVAGAIVMRGAFILAGIGLLTHFAWISYVFAIVLLIAAIKLLQPAEGEQDHEVPRWLQWISRLHPVSLRQDRFFVREDGRTMMTVMFLALLAIETTDLVFAIDSIPAVLSITQHPFVAYTSNIMAVMGLRSLYFLLAHLLTTLRYLHYGLAAVLAFAAIKMLIAHWYEIAPMLSLGVIVTLLGITVLASINAGPKTSTH